LRNLALFIRLAVPGRKLVIPSCLVLLLLLPISHNLLCRCGSPQQKTGLVGSSPDLVQFANELKLGGYGFKVIAMVREPYAAIFSAWNRRHSNEASFRATAFNLYMHLGYLDAQLLQLDESQRHFAYYEYLVANDNSTIHAISNFLNGGISFPVLSQAIRLATHSKSKQRRSLHSSSLASTTRPRRKHSSIMSYAATKNSNNYGNTHSKSFLLQRTINHTLKQQPYLDALYVRHLFYRPAAHSWFSLFWSYFQRYHCPSLSDYTVLDFSCVLRRPSSSRN